MYTKPPFTITNKIINQCTDISSAIARYEVLALGVPNPELRKHTQIRTIQSSLAIEGNTLTFDQVTDIINKKRVIGPKNEIREVKNAIKAYNMLDHLNPLSLSSLLSAHGILMEGLADDAGKLRKVNVGVGDGVRVIHMAPKHALVPKIMDNLFEFLVKENDLHPLIQSSVFHYELEFIHPFSDGNGRIGRLWQTLMLHKYNPVFAYIPTETMIKTRQQDYYDVLQLCGKKGDSSAFINFMLEVISSAVADLAKQLKTSKVSSSVRLTAARGYFKNKSFSRKDYLVLNEMISSATASRDLLWGVQNKILRKDGDRALTRYSFI